MNQTLEKFIPIADMLAETLGENCQIVLYDLTNQKNMMAHVVNNCVQNGELTRRIHPVIGGLLSTQEDGALYASNCMFVTNDKRLIKASVCLVRDDAGEAVGALCVLVDTKKTTDFVNWLLESLRGVPDAELYTLPAKPGALTLQQPMSDHISEIADELIDQIIGDRIATEMGREDKVAVVNIMEQKGLFLVKGAIEKVADKLGIAKVTVYSYLDEIKDKGEK